MELNLKAHDVCVLLQPNVLLQAPRFCVSDVRSITPANVFIACTVDRPILKQTSDLGNVWCAYVLDFDGFLRRFPIDLLIVENAKKRDGPKLPPSFDISSSVVC